MAAIINFSDAAAIKNAVRLEIMIPGDVLPGLRRWAREIEKQMTGVMSDEVAAAAAVSCFVDTVERVKSQQQDQVPLAHGKSRSQNAGAP